MSNIRTKITKSPNRSRGKVQLRRVTGLDRIKRCLRPSALKRRRRRLENLADIRDARIAIEAGEFVPWAQVKRDLGL